MSQEIIKLSKFTILLIGIAMTVSSSTTFAQDKQHKPKEPTFDECWAEVMNFETLREALSRINTPRHRKCVQVIYEHTGKTIRQLFEER